MASARENQVRSEIVEFELRGNSNEIAVRSLNRVPLAKNSSIAKPRALARSEEVQAGVSSQDAAKLSTGDQVKAVDSEAEGSGGVFGQENGIEVSVQERYRRELQAMLEKRKDYPLLAKRLRQQGKVLVRFTLQRDGSVTAAEVIENSQFDSLNQAARKLISEINGLKPFPAEIKRAQWVFVLPVEYRM